MIESSNFRSLETFLTITVIYVSLTFAFRLVYWLIGLWLFRRKRSVKPALLVDVSVARANA
jgi:polar amino acid transport system permease protein